MQSFLIALAFLTVLPIRFRGLPATDALARSRWYYPLVGMLLGGLVGGGMACLRGLPAPAPLAAFLVLALWVCLTGALHVDGFCDACDGLFGGRTPEDRLRIMRDPHLGAFGLAGGVLLLLGKFVVLEWLFLRSSGPWLVGTALAVARCLTICMAAGASYPRAEGTGKALVEAAKRWEGVFFAAVAAIFSVAGGGVFPALAGGKNLSDIDFLFFLLAFVVAWSAVLALKWLCRRRLRGVTGDCLGAAIELSELVFLLVVSCSCQWSVVSRP